MFCGDHAIGGTHVCGSPMCQKRALDLWFADQETFDREHGALNRDEPVSLLRRILGLFWRRPRRKHPSI
jgi:hypothetical protein